TLLADAHVAAGEAEKAIELLEQEVEARPNRVPALARLVLAYDAAAKPELDERARARSRELLELCTATGADTEVGLLWRCGVDVPGSRPGMSLALRADDGEPLFPEYPYAVGEDFGPRPELASLGPVLWRPFANAGFELARVQEGPRVRLDGGGQRSE